MDLSVPAARGKASDVRFVRKVLNADEQDAVFQSCHPNRALWACWAAKESAYKAMSKRIPAISSVPGRYAVSLHFAGDDGIVSGKVTTPGGTVIIRILFKNKFLHCIGTTGNMDHLNAVRSGVGTIPPNCSSGAVSLAAHESMTVRRLATKAIAEHLHVNNADIRIICQKMPNGIMPPAVYVQGNPQTMDISLSHDGRYAAYAFSATEQKGF